MRHHHALLAPLLVILTTVLAACGGGAPEDVVAVPAAAVAGSLTLDSDYRMDLGSGAEPIVCHDMRTTLTATFRFDGTVSRWTVALRSERSGKTGPALSVTENRTATAGVTSTTLTVDPGLAPLATTVPSRGQIGKVSAIVTLYGAGGRQAGTLTSNAVPVMTSCFH